MVNDITSLSHYHASFNFGFYQILTSMTELISFARLLASSSRLRPSFKVFSICCLPLKIASFFACNRNMNKTLECTLSKTDFGELFE